MLKLKRNSGAQHILLVEPDAFLSDIYEKNLVMEDFRVTKVGNAERAQKIAETKKPDLVITALMLPKNNGFELLSALKAGPATKDIPVIILTKLGTKDDVDKAMALGADGYIIKTHFQPSEIVGMVKKILFHKK